MKIDLIEILNKNEQLENKKKEIYKEKELRELIAAIIKGAEEVFIDNEELIKEIGIKISEKDKKYYVVSYYNPYKQCGTGNIRIKLNKENIKKINDYINKE